jgi:hypothetical protein
MPPIARVCRAFSRRVMHVAVHRSSCGQSERAVTLLVLSTNGSRPLSVAL